MFSGIIETTGIIKKINKSGSGLNFEIIVNKKNYLKNLPVGASISVNGACMTIEKKSGNKFSFTAVKETLKKTNLQYFITGAYVNLEKPIRLNSLLHGHIVSGHIDTIGKIKRIENLKQSWEFYFEFNKKFKKYVIEKGSICINGVSLTIAEIFKSKNNNQLIKIAIIPHTFKETIFRFNKTGDLVNLEFDIVGKYILNK